MLATDLSQTHEYVPLCDRDKEPEDRTVFVLRTMGAKLRTMISDAAAPTVDAGAAAKGEEGATVTVRSGSMQLERVRYGVEDWRNLGDPKKPDAEVKPAFCTKRNFVALTPQSLDAIAGVIPELASEIARVNRLEEEDDEGEAPGATTSGSSSSPRSSTVEQAPETV